MKKLFLMFGMLLTLACGGSPDDVQQAADIGQAQEAMGAKTRGATQAFGVSDDQIGVPCLVSGTGASIQHCVVPKKKGTVTWCLTSATGSFSSPEAADVNGGLAAVSGNGVSFLHFSDGASCDSRVNAGTVDIAFEVVTGITGVCPGGGTSQTIESYVCANPPSTASISSNLPGHWRTGLGAGVSFVILDRTDINSQSGGNTTVASALRKHGFAHAALKLLGIGARTDRTDLWTSRALNPAGSHSLSAAEQCVIASFDPSNPSTIAEQISGCTAD
jgi:hypothetical protein